MKLHISILASALVITASMHGMQQSGEKTPLNVPTNNQTFSGRTDEMVATKIYLEPYEEIVGYLPKAQSLPSEFIPAEGLKVSKEENVHEQAFKFKEQMASLKAAKASKDRKLAGLTCIGAICCCPCLVLAAISDCFCPKITININQNSSANNS